MRPVSNQPARFFATAKTHNFDDQSLINLDNFKFRPNEDQKNTYTYNIAKVVFDYLQPLPHRDYLVKDTLIFA